MSTPDSYIDLSDATSEGGHQINLWWLPSQPERIHLVIMDPRFVNGLGEKPGLRLVLSANPKSADYSPANFNRCARVLSEAGCPAPAEFVPEEPRHLRYRDAIIKALVGDGSALKAPTLTKTSPVPDEAEVCETCLCFVADLDKHIQAAHA